MLIAIALGGDALIDGSRGSAGLAPHWADGFAEMLLVETPAAFAVDCVSAIIWAPITSR